MPIDLDKISALEKMRNDYPADETFKLLWAQDLIKGFGNVTNISTIDLIFQSETTRRYLVDAIPLELLSVYTIGSFFRAGEKISALPVGVTQEIQITSTAHNRIVEAKDAFTDLEYGLNYPFEHASVFLRKQEFLSKRQKCVVFFQGGQKIIFPCSVLAGFYYFTSSSMRRQLFAQHLKGLYEKADIDKSSKHATIIMKPGSSNEDAENIARFALDPFATKRWDLVMNSIRAEKGQYYRLTVDFPVEQVLNISARGHLSPDKKVFIVFEILQENSEFPFETIEVQRRKHDNSKSSQAISAEDPDVNNQLTSKSPSEKYIHSILANRVRSSNPNLANISRKETSIDANPSNKGHYTTSSKVDDIVSLSVQPPTETNEKVAVAKVVRKKTKNKNKDEEKGKKEQGHMMPLQDYLEMAKKLEKLPGIYHFDITESTVFQKKRIGRAESETSNKERYPEGGDRNCAYISLRHKRKHICLVEIDQKNLLNRCSTFVLIGGSSEVKKEAEKIPQWFVENVKHEKMAKNLRKKYIELEGIKHPSGNLTTDHDNWCTRLLSKIT